MKDVESYHQEMELPGELFSNALCTALSTMTGFEVVKKDPLEDNQPFVQSIAGAMMLVGKKNMFLMISTDQKTAETLIAYMTGLDFSELHQSDLQDGITELANMVAGSAKKELVDTEYEYNLTVPFTIIGEDFHVLTKKKIEKYSQQFENSDVRIMLQIFSF